MNFVISSKQFLLKLMIWGVFFLTKQNVMKNIRRQKLVMSKTESPLRIVVVWVPDDKGKKSLIF